MAGLISTSIHEVHAEVLGITSAIISVRGVLDLARWQRAGYTMQIEEWMELEKRVRMYELGSLPPLMLVFAAPPVGARSSSGGCPRLWRGRRSAPEVHRHERESGEERGYRGKGALTSFTFFEIGLGNFRFFRMRSRLRALVETALELK
jgi:hypothetical protein